jgi:tetratricopeptide (TPR) repeat protein
LLLADEQPDYAHLLRGEALFRQQQYGQAVAELNRLTRPDEDVRLDAALIMGQCLLLENQPGQAERLFKFVLDHRPDSADAHRCLAWIYHDQGAAMRAVEHARQWGRLESHNGRPYWMMGEIHQDLEHWPEAVECYQEALRRELPPDVPDKVRQQLAECLAKQLNWGPALEALDGEPPLAETAERQALRVECLWGLGRADEARLVLERSLAAFPRGAELLRIGAEIRRADDRLSEAAALLVRALDEDRHDPVSRHKLALVYEAMGRGAEAAEQRRLEAKTKRLFEEIDQLRTEAANDLWNPKPRLRLARIFEEMGQDKLAKMWREAANACGPAKAEP